MDEPAADDGRAADRRDRAHRGRGALGPGRAPVRAAAELRLPAAAPRVGGTTARRRARRDVVEVVERLERDALRVEVRARARRERRPASRPARRSGRRSRRRRRRTPSRPATSSACTARRRRGTARLLRKTDRQPSGRGSSRFAATSSSSPRARARARSARGSRSRRRAARRGDELGEPGSQRDVARAPRRRPPSSGAHGLELARDDLVQRQVAPEPRFVAS